VGAEFNICPETLTSPIGRLPSFQSVSARDILFPAVICEMESSFQKAEGALQNFNLRLETVSGCYGRKPSCWSQRAATTWITEK